MKVFVPTSWSEITVGEFMQLSALNSEDKPSKRLADIISILCGVDAFSLTTETVKEIQESLTFMNGEMPKDRFESFKHDGIKYEWIKSLNEITLGEQISIEQTIETEELNYAQSFDLVMAVLLRTDKEVFNAKDINKKRELFSTFPIDKVHGIILFFLNGGKIYSRPTAGFLVLPKVKKTETNGVMKKSRLTKKLAKKMLVAVLSGLHLLTALLKTILRSMK